tara:strand:- start:967 stop:1578 length:612 start_codon:yes stop_codon:yes gene_type:complete
MHTNEIFSILEQTHHPTMLELLKNHTPFQQLVATLLSSRTKDSTTIPIVLKLFKKYLKPNDFLNIKEEELYGIGFYKVKTKNIHKLSKIIIEKYNNNIPSTFEKLTSLPGVGRKTANCVLAYTFKQPAIAVDVHVHRISNRLGWVKTNTPEETEEELKKIVDKKNWNKINKLFVSHGQTTCFPIKPNCKGCKIKQFCGFVTSK